ncbi:unnamed protein product, partial [Choristocarpus tenellus]
MGRPLLLDSAVNPVVDVTVDNSLLNDVVLPSTSTRTNCLALPVAGSREWLPHLVAIGREEALTRTNNYDDTGGVGHEIVGAFFIVDIQCIVHKFRRWHECFPRVKPFYAVKCNSNQAVVRALSSFPGCGFDCASPAEINQVLSCGVDPSRVIYANPCKAVDALNFALSVGIVTMTFDSREELHKIRHALDSQTK